MYRLVRPDGEIRWIQETGRTIFEKQVGIRQPIRILGSVIDITEQKAMDDKLHHLNVTLESGLPSRPVKFDYWRKLSQV